MELHKTNVHEAHLLASMVAEYNQISREEFDVRVSESKSWNVCDCRYIFLYKTPFALDLIHQYADNQS